MNSPFLPIDTCKCGSELTHTLLDCLRDIGLDQECYKVGTGESEISQIRWAHSLLGEEYGRVSAWGTDPRRGGDYKAASPSVYVSHFY